jgi:hypothetical protein
MRDGVYRITYGPVSEDFTVEDGRITPGLPRPAMGPSDSIRRLDTFFRMLFTGSRDYGDRRAGRDPAVDRASVHRDLLAVQTKFGCRTDQMVIVEGEAEGLDSVVRDTTTELGMRVEPHPADWDTCAPACKPGHRKRRRDGTEYCPSAGHRRNAVMVASVTRRPAAGRGCVAYPLDESRGTRGCMKLAVAAGLTVWNRTDGVAQTV